MAKLKLKTVQNGTEGEMANLMDSGSYDYVDCSGYVIIGSGLYDNSGHVVEEGRLFIDAGHADIDIGSIPAVRVNASWDSGYVDLPISFTFGAGEPCIPVSFKFEHLLGGIGNFVTIEGDVLITEEWRSPVSARVHASYVLTDENGSYANFSGFMTFGIPYSYVPPLNNDN